MTRIVDWALSHGRMVLATLVLAIVTGITAYFTLPKEGSPDIEFPSFFISVTFPGISSEDSERLLVKPLESQLSQLDGLDEMFGTAAEGYAGIALNFDFGIDKPEVLAEIRDLLSRAEAEFPEGANKATVAEFSFSEIPIIVVALSGDVSDRVLMRLGDQIKDQLEALPPVLDVIFNGERKEMIEVIIDPLRLDAYNVSLNDQFQAVSRNNQLVAIGEVETENGAFSVKIPSSFEELDDIREIPLTVTDDRLVTVADVADVRLTFEDRRAYNRHNGDPTVALQVVKTPGTNIIQTALMIRATVAAIQQTWPEPLQDAVNIEFVQDQSYNVSEMVTQLENSVLTAVLLVMVVVLAVLGTRSSILVGIAIPSSFLFCFTFLAILSIPISNIVMFGLILAVGMLVDSAIVIVELADRRMEEGDSPRKAFGYAAKRMFWPIISSTATTLCAFLPLLFWPGISGQWMGRLPLTVMFVLSASLLVALIFLPVVGSASGTISLFIERISARLRQRSVILRLALFATIVLFMVCAVILTLVPDRFPFLPLPAYSVAASAPGAILFAVGAFLLSTVAGSLKIERKKQVTAGWKRSPFGSVISVLVGNPVMPLVSIATVIAAVVGIFTYYGQNNAGVEFFADNEPETLRIHVRARGNLSLHEKDRIIREVEDVVIGAPGVASVFSFTGGSGLNSAFFGRGPLDGIGVVQVDFDLWSNRQAIGGIATDARDVTALIQRQLSDLPGIFADVEPISSGPITGKPLNLRLTGYDWDELLVAAEKARTFMGNMQGINYIEDTLPLPGIDWKIDVDVEEAGRYGTDVATVGAMVQFVTRGIELGTMRPAELEDEISIRVRFPESDRHLSTLDDLRVRSSNGLVPLSNFITWYPEAQIGEIARFNQNRYIDVRADLQSGLFNEEGRPITPTERIALMSDWLANEADLPASVFWQWVGDQEQQQESQTFLTQAFIAALALMFAVLLAQFNSFYNAVLVLVAIVLSTVGVLLGLLLMGQKFSIVMTGLGVVALAGIVVNNNIVLIDTYQEYSRIMPKIEAIIRTAQLRIRPVLLTSITTIAGLLPMMFGYSINIVEGGYIVDTPTSAYWSKLATAIVFGLATSTILTLIVTPSLLAIRIWTQKGSYRIFVGMAATVAGSSSDVSRDLRLRKALRRHREPTILWRDEHV
ncbi:MAG: efflux RND transporter permease subunit [Rhodobacteraceae bacterium]|nr:efflux RND transporter permease subunit [Paracoccaceae bacterium]